MEMDQSIWDPSNFPHDILSFKIIDNIPSKNVYDFKWKQKLNINEEKLKKLYTINLMKWLTFNTNLKQNKKIYKYITSSIQNKKRQGNWVILSGHLEIVVFLHSI